LLACLTCVDVDERLTGCVENLEAACPTSRGFVGPASAKQGPNDCAGFIENLVLRLNRVVYGV